MVVERGIAVSYKYNPLASVPVPEICVPVLCSRAQKVAVIVIKRKCRLIPDLPAPVAQLFVPGGSVDIMTNGCDGKAHGGGCSRIRFNNIEMRILT